MTRRDLPNLITIMRLALVAPLVWYLLMERYGAALAIALVAGLSDALDGYLAKRYEWSSRLGGILDPIADKLLLVSGFVALGLSGLLPLWLVALVLLRDLVIVVGAALYHWLVARLEPEPSGFSKVNTAFQITLLLAVLLSQVLAGVPDALVEGLVWLTALSTGVSGAHYVWTWGRLTWRQTRGGAVHE